MITRAKPLEKISYKDASGIQLFRPLALAKLGTMQDTLHGSQPVYLVTYADDCHGVRGGLYRQMQNQILQETRRCKVVRNLPFNFKDLIDTEEYNRDPAYFKLHPFANGHAFKPVIIRKALNLVEDGDFVLYYDCSRYSLGSTIPLLAALCVANGGALTWQYGDPNAMWVKKSVYEACGDYQMKFAKAPHLATTWFMFKVNPRLRQFVSIWADLNCKQEIAEEREFSHVSSGQSMGSELREYVDNRGDQSIFSVLCSVYGYSGFFGAGYGLNRAPKMFCLSMLIGSQLFRVLHRLRGAGDEQSHAIALMRKNGKLD